jgi:hypothetical protein
MATPDCSNREKNNRAAKGGELKPQVIFMDGAPGTRPNHYDGADKMSIRLVC